MPWPRCVKDITRESFILTHTRSQDFVFSMWSSDARLYAVWSTMCSIYTVSMTVVTGITSVYGTKILIWLTYWSFYCLTLRFLFSACNSWLHVLKTSRDRRCQSLEIQRQKEVTSETISSPNAVALETVQHNNRPSNQTMITQNPSVRHTIRRRKYPVKGKLPVNVACQWLLQNVSNVVAVLISILYWTLIYTGEHQSHNSINSHVINAVLVVTDVMISRAPVRLQHFHMPLAFLSVYIGFTIVYWSAGGTNQNGEIFIYSVLDYSNRPATAAIAITFVGLLGIPLAQLFFYGLYRARTALHSSCQKHSCTSQKGVYFIDLNGTPAATDGNTSNDNSTCLDQEEEQDDKTGSNNVNPEDGAVPPTSLETT